MYRSPTFFALSMSPFWDNFNIYIIDGKPQRRKYYFASLPSLTFTSLWQPAICIRGLSPEAKSQHHAASNASNAQSKKLEERAYTVCKDQTARRQIAKRRKQEGRKVLFNLQRAKSTLIVWPSGAPIATSVQQVPTLAPFPTIFKLLLLSYSNYFYYSIISKQRILIYTVPYSATQYRYVIIEPY